MTPEERTEFEKQMPFYEAFFGHRIAPSLLTKQVRADFGTMINNLESDLKFFHEDVGSAKIREAIIIALTVMHRLEARHPNAYTKMPEIGIRAFKHADRFLLDDPLPLPPIVDTEELADHNRAQREKRRENLEQARETRKIQNTPPSAETSRNVSEFLNNWRENKQLPQES